jgi:hypothetical protein
MDKNLFNFEDMAKSGLKTAKKIADKFKKLNVPVAGQPAIDAKVRRSSGISYREITIVFKDSQKVVLRVKQTGDIYQVLLNGRDIPIKHQDDQNKAIVEVANALNARRSAFQKTLAKVRVPIKSRGVTVTKKALVIKLTERSAELSEAISDAEVELAAVKSGKEPGADEYSYHRSAGTELESAELKWLQDVAAGTIDVSSELKGARDRIRAAQKVDELKGAADAAAEALKAAAIAKAKAITGAAMDNAADTANAIADAPNTTVLPQPAAEPSQATPAAVPVQPPQEGAISTACPVCGAAMQAPAPAVEAKLDDAADTANAIAAAPNQAKLPHAEAVPSQATPSASPILPPAEAPSTLCPACVAANKPSGAKMDTAADTANAIAHMANDARLPASDAPPSQANRASVAVEPPAAAATAAPLTGDAPAQDDVEASALAEADRVKKQLADGTSEPRT